MAAEGTCRRRRASVLQRGRKTEARTFGFLFSGERARATRSPIQSQYGGLDLCIHEAVSWSHGGGGTELVLNSTL